MTLFVVKIHVDGVSLSIESSSFYRRIYIDKVYALRTDVFYKKSMVLCKVFDGELGHIGFEIIPHKH